MQDAWNSKIPGSIATATRSADLKAVPHRKEREISCQKQSAPHLIILRCTIPRDLGVVHTLARPLRRGAMQGAIRGEEKNYGVGGGRCGGERTRQIKEGIGVNTQLSVGNIAGPQGSVILLHLLRPHFCGGEVIIIRRPETYLRKVKTLWFCPPISRGPVGPRQCLFNKHFNTT